MSKLEELASRADDKQRSITQLNRKIDQDVARLPSPSRRTAAGDENLDHLEVQSEFSTASNETEIRTDENILDFKVEDAEFYYDHFGQVPSVGKLTADDETSFITLMTVDFFNCPSETTGLAEGFRPNYNTQISFKNKVDKFYLSALEKQTVKLDVYMSKNNAAVHVGRAEIMLR